MPGAFQLSISCWIWSYSGSIFEISTPPQKNSPTRPRLEISKPSLRSIAVRISPLRTERSNHLLFTRTASSSSQSSYCREKNLRVENGNDGAKERPTDARHHKVGHIRAAVFRWPYQIESQTEREIDRRQDDDVGERVRCPYAVRPRIGAINRHASSVCLSRMHQDRNFARGV